jgi:hypothetical protein
LHFCISINVFFVNISAIDAYVNCQQKRWTDQPVTKELSATYTLPAFAAEGEVVKLDQCGERFVLLL